MRGLYDLQDLRIQTGLRVVANFKVKLGIEPGTKEERQVDADQILKDIRASYRRMTDKIAKLPKMKQFKGDQVISDYSELCMAEQYFTLLNWESEQFKRMGDMLSAFPIWNEWLKGVHGIGPAMAGCIISELDPSKARNVSCFWKYVGIDVAPDGRGRSNKKHHLVKKDYTDKKGEVSQRDSVTYNPWIKKKLVGVLSEIFIRSGSEYRKVYDNYKHRLENHGNWGVHNDGKWFDSDWRHIEKPEGKELLNYVNKGHRHNMAKRYMIKIFLQDLWLNWRKLEGLPVTLPYAESKLGHRPHDAA